MSPQLCTWEEHSGEHRLLGPDGHLEGLVKRVGGLYSPSYGAARLPMADDLVRAKIAVARERAKSKGALVER